MALKGSTRVSDQTRASSLLDLTATGARLIPKQLKDEAALAGNQLKKKGISLGVGAGLAGVGLFFGLITLISLVVALIGGFASATDIWFWALMVAAGGFVIMLVLILIGITVIRGAMPVVPQETIRGFKHDLGYLREGNDFDPVEFDRLEAEKAERRRAEKMRQAELRKQAQKAEKAAVKRGEAATSVPSTTPSADELRQRVELRRRHLGDIRSGLDEKTDLKAQFASFTAQATGKSTPAGQKPATSPVAPYTTAARAGQKVNDVGEYAKDNWQPLALLGASSTALAVFFRKLKKK